MRRSTKGHIVRLLEADSIGGGLLVDGIDVVVRRVSRGALLSMYYLLVLFYFVSYRRDTIRRRSREQDSYPWDLERIHCGEAST